MRPITAADLMNPEVLTVPEDMTVRELATFLMDNEITGAPVVDREGRLVGVVSVVDIADVAAGEEEDEQEGSDGSEGSGGVDYFAQSWEVGLSDEAREELELEDEQGEILVGEIMNPELYSVPEDATVAEVAMTMLKNHIHRLLVIEEGKAVGIITTSDLLGLLVEGD
jgi:CBS domain-containing protein